MTATATWTVERKDRQMHDFGCLSVKENDKKGTEDEISRDRGDKKMQKCRRRRQGGGDGNPREAMK